VATISRLLEIAGLFCKRALLKRRYSAKETYNFEKSINRSHPIHDIILRCISLKLNRHKVGVYGGKNQEESGGASGVGGAPGRGGTMAFGCHRILQSGENP